MNPKPKVSHYNKPHIGIDEAGRGTLIGRVYAACVIFKDTTTQPPVNIIDSKKLTPPKRRKAFEWIKNNTFWGIGYADEKEVDDINILQATRNAMERSIFDLKSKYEAGALGPQALARRVPNCLLIDGSGWNGKFKDFEVVSVVGGDSKYYSIAAASILAKEFHDDHIKELVNGEPELNTKYSLLTNMGYATKKHKDGIREFGKTKYHRQTFKCVK